MTNLYSVSDVKGGPEIITACGACLNSKQVSEPGYIRSKATWTDRPEKECFYCGRSPANGMKRTFSDGPNE